MPHASPAHMMPFPDPTNRHSPPPGPTIEHARRTPAAEGLSPPPPRHIKGRTAELATLARTIAATRPARLALVGAGGSGKSLLAAALAHRVARGFPGGIHWF